MKPVLSIIITSLEDYQETQYTIESIRATAGDDVEVIVVDDATQVPLSLTDKKSLLIRNNERAGVGPSRHIGATVATSDYLLITDSHMRFEPGWLDRALKRIVGRLHTIHCASCVALSPDMMDMARAQHAYCGAGLNLYGADKNKHGVTQILEGVWLPTPASDDQPLACIMGATYFMPTDWFFHINGLRMLRGWGSDEPLLSIKTWLAGGECRALPGVRIGHQFRPASPYRTANWNLIYNKMMIARTCMDTALANKLCRLFEGAEELITAKTRMTEDMGQILAERTYLQSIFVHDFPWYCAKFNITIP